MSNLVRSVRVPGQGRKLTLGLAVVLTTLVASSAVQVDTGIAGPGLCSIHRRVERHFAVRHVDYWGELTIVSDVTCRTQRAERFS